jgi:AbrB family looped-hinge helix DNA binding protein
VARLQIALDPIRENANVAWSGFAGGGAHPRVRREAGWPEFFTLKVKKTYHCRMTSTVSSKGQVTVPKGVRDRLGLRTGTIVEFEITGAGVLLRKGHKGMRPVDRVRGILGRSRSTDDLINEMRGPAPAARGARR